MSTALHIVILKEEEIEGLAAGGWYLSDQHEEPLLIAHEDIETEVIQAARESIE